MGTLIHDPWVESRWEQWKARIVALAVLVGGLAGIAAILSAPPAMAQGEHGCTSVLVIGDYHSVGVEEGGLEDLLNEKGVENVEFDTERGRNISDVENALSSHDINGDCLVIEVGSRDSMENDEEEIRSDINSLVSSASDANHIYWVAPVSQDSAERWRTNEFGEYLEDEVGDNGDVTIIDTSSVSGASNFLDNGINMTESGYNQRAILISNHFDSPDNESDQATPGDGDNGGNNGSGNDGAGNNGGNNGAGNGAATGAVPPGSLGDAPAPENQRQVCDGREGDCFNGNPDSVSPKAFADRAMQMNNFSDATQYLAIGRWDAIQIPTPEFNILAPSSMFDSMYAGLNSFLFSITQFFMKLAMYLTNYAFTNGLMNPMVILADLTFATALGGNTSAGATGLFYASIFTVALIFGLGRVMNVKSSGDMRNRALEFGMSMAKVLVALLFVSFMATQSGRNSSQNERVQEAITQELEEQSDQIMTPGTEGEAVNTDDSIGQNIGGRSVSDMTSWHAGSLGWVISFFYWLGNILATAITNIVGAMTVGVVDWLRQGLEGAAYGADDEAPACDRFFGSMHLTFGETQAMRSSGANTNVLTSLDVIYHDFFLKTFRQVYGGNTFSSGNSWCWQLEVVNQSPVGDWMMIARGANLYYDVIGRGKLVGDAGRYANGNTSLVSADANTSSMGGSMDGFLVNAQGNWTSNDPAKNYPARARIYMSGRDEYSTTQARYYFSACEWAPDQTRPRLHEQWRGVRAMGESGGSDGGTSADDLGAASDASVGVEETYEVLPELVEKANQTNGATATIMGDAAEQPFLSDADCFSYRNLPIGVDDDEAAIGFGGTDEMPQRWAYAPVNPTVQAMVADTVKDSIGNIPGVGGLAKAVEFGNNLAGDPIGTISDGVGQIFGGGEEETQSQSLTGNDPSPVEEAILSASDDEGTSDDEESDDGGDEGTSNDDDDEDSDDEDGTSEDDDDDGDSGNSSSRPDEDGSDVDNPRSKFGGSIMPDGSSPAFEFWSTNNGYNSQAYSITSLLVFLLMIAIVIFLSIPTILAFFVNFILSLMFMFIPAMLLVILITFTLKGGK